ncbi:hypothetical protein AAVH_29968, partial [Aphelenchoides avenae]
MQSGAPRKRRDSSPAPCAVKRAAVVTESAAEPTVAVPLAFLKNLSTAVGAIMNGLMTLPCEDVAARGRHVANLSKVQSSINEQLGVKKRSFGTGSGSDVLLDAFSWLKRRDLDKLSIVNACFNEIIMGKMNHVCLRQLDKAKTYRRQADGQFVCVLSELEATKQFRFPTGTSDAAQAFGLLLSACRWSCVEKLKTNDAVPLNSDVFNQIIVYAPLIRVIHFQMGYRTCTFDVLPELAIRMTNSFTALEKFSIDAGRTALSVTNALVGNCFKNGTTIVICDTRCISEDALMEFSFGECD